MRERELKLGRLTRATSEPVSLPMRERELKRGADTLCRAGHRSLPMRERELKPEEALNRHALDLVAPHAGA